MNLVASLLATLAPLFGLILTGYGLRRWAKVLHDHHVPILNSLVIDVTLPATVFLAIARAPSIPVSYGLLPVVLIIAQLCAFGLAYGFGKLLRLPKPTMGMLLLTSAFGNTAFLGYPVLLAIMPKFFPAGVLLDEFGMTIMMYLAASVFAARYGSQEREGDRSVGVALAKFFRGAIFLSVVAGMLGHACRGHLPEWTHVPVAMGLQILTYLGQATTPLILLTLGAALRPREAASAVLFIPGVIKLIAVPMIMWCLFQTLGLPHDLLSVCVVQASMPTAVVVSLLCEKYGMDGARAGGVVCATTAASLVTIPLMQALLR